MPIPVHDHCCSFGPPLKLTVGTHTFSQITTHHQAHGCSLMYQNILLCAEYSHCKRHACAQRGLGCAQSYVWLRRCWVCRLPGWLPARTMPTTFPSCMICTLDTNTRTAWWAIDHDRACVQEHRNMHESYRPQDNLLQRGQKAPASHSTKGRNFRPSMTESSISIR